MFFHRVGKDEFGFRIDEVANQPGRTDTIDVRRRTGDPGSALIILGAQRFFLGRLCFIGLERFCFPEEPFEIIAP